MRSLLARLSFVALASVPLIPASAADQYTLVKLGVEDFSDATAIKDRGEITMWTATPTPASGTLYTGPVAITTNPTLRAIAYKPHWINSAVTSVAYKIKHHKCVERQGRRREGCTSDNPHQFQGDF